MFDANALMAGLLGAAMGGGLVAVAGLALWRRHFSILAVEQQNSLGALEGQFEQRLKRAQAIHADEVSAALALATQQREAAMRAQRDQLQERHERALEVAQRRYEEQVKKVESPLTVLVHPFVNTSVDKGLIRNTSIVEVGYKYQLMVQGIPCFPPHDVVVERQTKVETDEAAIAAWSAKALELAKAAAQIKGGGIAGTLISVAKTVVLGRK